MYVQYSTVQYLWKALPYEVVLEFPRLRLPPPSQSLSGFCPRTKFPFYNPARSFFSLSFSLFPFSSIHRFLPIMLYIPDQACIL